MLVLYNEINKSNLPPTDKQKAYGKLMYVFTALSNEEVYDTTPTIISLGKYLFPISLVIIVLLIIFFIRPQFSLTGLAVADYNTAPYWDDGNPAFKVNGITEINLGVYFADDDGDILSYDVSSAPNLDIEINGDILKITPDPFIKGLRVVRITAYDESSSAQVIATLDIQ
jgi:hypothetical protein